MHILYCRSIRFLSTKAEGSIIQSQIQFELHHACELFFASYPSYTCQIILKTTHWRFVAYHSNVYRILICVIITNLLLSPSENVTATTWSTTFCTEYNSTRTSCSLSLIFKNANDSKDEKQHCTYKISRNHSTWRSLGVCNQLLQVWAVNIEGVNNWSQQC